MDLLNKIDMIYVCGALISLCAMAFLLALNCAVDFVKGIIKRFRGKHHVG